MTYQEKNIVVSLFSTLLYFGYYAINVYRMYEEGNINSTGVFSLWGTVIVLGIIINIVSSILTHIVFAIIYRIRTNEDEVLIEDERDKLIGLKGARNAYMVFAIGVLLSMTTFVINLSPLVMFMLLIFSGIGAQIVGDLSRLYLYRSGM